MKQPSQLTQSSLQPQPQINYKKMLGIGSNYSHTVGKIRYYLNLLIKNIKNLITILYEKGILSIIILIIIGFGIHYALTHIIAINKALVIPETFKNYNYSKNNKSKNNQNKKDKKQN